MSSNFDINLEMKAVGFDQAWQAMDKLTTATNTMVQSQNGVATATNKTDQALGATKVTITGLVASLGTVTSSSWNLYSAWESLRKSQLAAQGAQIKVKSSLLAVEAAQKKYNAAVSEYGAGSKEAATASEKLAIAQEKLSRNQEIAALKARDVTESHAQFATQLPGLITGVVSAATSFAQMYKEMGGLKGLIPTVISAVQGLGTALRFLFTTPVGLVITAIASAFTLLATNAFGARDAVNNIGKSLGDAVPAAKGFLETLGGNMNALLNFINPAQDATTATTGLGDAMSTSGETFVLAEAQVRGLDGSLVNLSDVVFDVVGAHKELAAQEAVNEAVYQKYKQAQLTGNNDIISSYNLTKEQIIEFKKRFDKEMQEVQKAAEESAKKAAEAHKKAAEEFAKAWLQGIEQVKGSFAKFAESGLESLTSAGSEAAKLSQQMFEKEIEFGEKTKKERRKGRDEHRQDMAELRQQVEAAYGGMSNAARQSADAAYAWGEQAKSGLSLFTAEALSGNFPAAVNGLKTMMDDAPAKWSGAFSQFDTIMNNTALTAEQKTDLMAANFTQLEKSMEPLIVAGHTYTATQAEMAAGLDELAVKARAGVTDMTQMDDAWVKFTGSLTPAQKALPIVQSAMAGVSSGAITAADAFKIVEAAGQTMSAALGTTVTTSFDQLEKQVIKTSDTTGVAFASINGQMVSLGNVTVDAVTGKVVPALQGAGTQMATTAQSAQTELATKSTASIGVLDTAFVTAAGSIGTTMGNINLGFIGTATNMKTYIEGQAVASLLVLEQAFTTFATVVTTAITTINTQIGVMTTTTGTQLTAMATKTEVVTTAFNTLAASVTTATTKMNTAIGVFVTTSASQLAKVSQSTTQVTTAVGVMATTMNSQMSAMSSKVSSFASSFSSAMSKITTSMKTATSAAKSLASAINALKSKTITITTRYVTTGSPGGMHGAQWMTGGGAGGFQHGGRFFHAQGGFSGMVNRPTNFKGGRMGEGFRPEMVTVTPLTRGTGNHTGPTVGRNTSIGGGGNQVVNVTVVLDGRVIQRFVEKTALAGIGVQI